MRSFSSSLSSLPLFCSLCRSLTLCIVVPRLSLLKYRRLCLQRLCSADRHPRGVARRRERQRRRQWQHLAPRQFPFGLFDRALRAAAAAAAAGPVAGPAAPRQAQGHRARCRLEEPRRCRSLLLSLFFSLFFLWRRRRHLLSPSLWQLAPDHHRRARHPRLNSRLTIDCARSLPPPFLSSFSFSFLPENSSADLFCPWSSSISQKKNYSHQCLQRLLGPREAPGAGGGGRRERGRRARGRQHRLRHSGGGGGPVVAAGPFFGKGVKDCFIFSNLNKFESPGIAARRAATVLPRFLSLLLRKGARVQERETNNVYFSCSFHLL